MTPSFRKGVALAEIATTMSGSNFEIAVSRQDAAWGEHLKDLDSLAEQTLRAAWRHLAAARPGDAPSRPTEVSLVFADDDTVAELNRDYRGRQGPTNVLSFPNMDDDLVPGGAQPRLLGDVILARQTVQREAVEQDKTLQAHTAHLLIHGFLHLLGYDHQDEAEASEMEALEVAILADLGLADPYASTTARAQPSAVGASLIEGGG